MRAHGVLAYLVALIVAVTATEWWPAEETGIEEVIVEEPSAEETTSEGMPGDDDGMGGDDDYYNCSEYYADWRCNRYVECEWRPAYPGAYGHQGSCHSRFSGGDDGDTPAVDPAYSPAMDPAYSPAMSPGTYPGGYYPNMYPAQQPGMYPAMNPAYSPAMDPAYSPGMSPGMYPDGYYPNMYPAMNPAYSPGMHPAMYPAEATLELHIPGKVLGNGAERTGTMEYFDSLEDCEAWWAADLGGIGGGPTHRFTYPQGLPLGTEETVCTSWTVDGVTISQTTKCLEDGKFEIADYLETGDCTGSASELRLEELDKCQMDEERGVAFSVRIDDKSGICGGTLEVQESTIMYESPYNGEDWVWQNFQNTRCNGLINSYCDSLEQCLQISRDDDTSNAVSYSYGCDVGCRWRYTTRDCQGDDYWDFLFAYDADEELDYKWSGTDLEELLFYEDEAQIWFKLPRSWIESPTTTSSPTEHETSCGAESCLEGTKWDHERQGCVATPASCASSCGFPARTKKGKTTRTTMVDSACECEEECKAVQKATAWQWTPRGKNGKCTCLLGDKIALTFSNKGPLAGFIG